MMKTTQFLTNIKSWQSSLVALLFLFSFTVNSQSVGDDLMAATNGALSTTDADAGDPVNGVAGQGQSCSPCGWSGAAGVNYAPSTDNHGPTHSGDRMWKTFAGNGGNGEFVNQVFTDIAAGTYTLTFYHRWTNAGNLDYSAGAGPQVTFKKSDGNGGWLDGYAAEVPQGNIGANADWTENVHTIEVAEAGTYRMQVYKNGGTNASPNPMNGCLHLDTFSLVYDAEPVVPDCEFSIVLSDSYGDGWNGNSLDVLVAGEVVLDDITIADGSEATFSFGGQNGDTVAVVYDDSGSYDGENSYEVFNNLGNSVVQNSGAGGGFSDPGPSGAEFTFECLSECEFTLVLEDSYGDGWNGNSIVLSVNGVDITEQTIDDGTTSSYVFGVNSGDVISLTYNDSGSYDGENSYSLLDNAGNVVASQAGAGGGFSDPGPASTTDLAVACSYDPVPQLELIGIMDFNVNSVPNPDGGNYGGTDGKALHLVALADIADLSAYGIGTANNGSGSDGVEHVLSGSVSAGDHILLARTPAAIDAYMGTSGFAHIETVAGGGSSAAGGNGDDPVELFMNFVVDENGNVTDDGIAFAAYGDANDNSSLADTEDSWAYKVDGVWTAGAAQCTDNTLSSCTSDCPYPFIADACPFVPTVIDGGACLDFEGDSATDGWRFQNLGAADSDWQLDTPALSGENSLGHGYFPTSVSYNDLAVSPTFNTSAMTDAQLRYSEYMDWSADGTANYVMYTLDDPATLDPATANVVVLDGPEINAAAEDTWVERVFDLPEAEQVTLIFNYVGTYGHSWNVDDVCVEEVPPPPFHDVTFNVDARNIIVHDRGMFMGGGVLGGADAVAMSDEDGDGIWSVTLNLQEGTTGNWAFFNSPGDGGDWGTKENLDGQPCADVENYNDRVVPAFDANNLEFNFCFAVCNDTNSFCAETVERADVTFTVGTADIEVGPNGMYVGGGAFGGSNGHAMADNGDDTHSVTISVPVGQTGHFAFINSPDNHYDWGKKENLNGLECADESNYWDRPLTGDVAYTYCFATCETECAAPSTVISEFPACFDFEGETALEGWAALDYDPAVTSAWQLYNLDLGDNPDNNMLGHIWEPVDVSYNDFAISPQFNTSGMTDAQLSFDEVVNYGQFAGAHNVWVSTDEVLSFESDNLVLISEAVNPDGLSEVVLDLPEAEYVTVIFQYAGIDGSAWLIDNMCVAEAPAEPNFVTADPSNAWIGYMEVFDLDGNFQFGNPWDVADLQTVIQPDVPNMILYPNFNTYANAVNSGDPGELEYWTNGEMGNKIMRATTQVESWDMYNGADLTFTGSVAEHTLEGYDTVYFIKCLDPDAGWTDMLGGAYVLPLPESGEFSVSVSGDLLPAGKLVQFGFAVVGLNANPAFDYGKVVIGDAGLSIGENDSLDMVIYPNPVDGDYVTIQTPLNGDKLVEVFDINGRKVMERLLTTNTLNVSSISAGMYIVKVTVEGQSNVSKLIIE